MQPAEWVRMLIMLAALFYSLCFYFPAILEAKFCFRWIKMSGYLFIHFIQVIVWFVLSNLRVIHLLVIIVKCESGYWGSDQSLTWTSDNWISWHYTHRPYIVFPFKSSGVTDLKWFYCFYPREMYPSEVRTNVFYSLNIKLLGSLAVENVEPSGK